MRSFILAIDPGTTASGIVLMNSVTYRPLYAEKIANEEFLEKLEDILPCWPHEENVEAVIEMVSHYGTGMPAGREVFETCIWIGRFWQKLKTLEIPVATITRKSVKMQICGHDAGVRDVNIRIVLCDRFAFGCPNFGKGSKAHPGFFYGFKADIWAAYAVGVAYIDSKKMEDKHNG